jgi:hypothetical protein
VNDLFTALTHPAVFGWVVVPGLAAALLYDLHRRLSPGRSPLPAGFPAAAAYGLLACLGLSISFSIWQPYVPTAVYPVVALAFVASSGAMVRYFPDRTTGAVLTELLACIAIAYLGEALRLFVWSRLGGITWVAYGLALTVFIDLARHRLSRRTCVA